VSKEPSHWKEAQSLQSHMEIPPKYQQFASVEPEYKIAAHNS